ncbi:hypothetical protein [Nereida ignava]|uniref:hypothetical protein n=1 Tax=Nereida ignava TaxID=282199 RepID=UPI003F6C860F
MLVSAGADGPSAEAATKAMIHGSLHGIDSHGIRLLPHYNSAFRGGRINGAPRMTLEQSYWIWYA